MDRTAVKKFAIEARRILLQQVAAQTERLEITIDRITEPQTVSGGLIVAGITLDPIESQQYQQLRRRRLRIQRSFCIGGYWGCSVRNWRWGCRFCLQRAIRRC